MNGQESLFGQATDRHDAGGKSRPPWPKDSTVYSIFGGERDIYRYFLIESWDGKKQNVLWVMMNPSTAGLENADSTLIKTGKFARLWGFGSQSIVNVHAYRATDKTKLLLVQDPVGPDNRRHILEAAERSALIVMAYGRPPRQLRLRGLGVHTLLIENGHLPRMAFMRLSNDGTPWHPLYIPDSHRPAYFHDRSSVRLPAWS